MVDEPTAEDAAFYMELCAALVLQFGEEHEVIVEQQHFPQKPHRLMRKYDEEGNLVVRFQWEE